MNNCSFIKTVHIVHFNNFYFSKFDLPILIPTIMKYCVEKDFLTSILPKGGKMSYFNLQKEKDVDVIQFRDILTYTSPCSLDKFLRQWKTAETKGCFPHG